MFIYLYLLIYVNLKCQQWSQQRINSAKLSDTFIDTGEKKGLFHLNHLFAAHDSQEITNKNGF